MHVGWESKNRFQKSGRKVMNTFSEEFKDPDWKIVEALPTRGGEADIFIIERKNSFQKSVEKRILKRYRYGFSPNLEVLQRLVNLSEENPELFVRIFEYGKNPQSQCFFEIEEFFPEGSLAGELILRRFDGEEIFEIARGITKGLYKLHENEILHLDLKPGNILLRKNRPPQPVIADFGLSSVFDSEFSKKLTQFKGSFLYQSPESIAGFVVPKSDWWSFGIILLELLAGKHPLEDLQRQVVLYQLTTRGIEIPSDLPPRWRSLLMGLLTRNPEKRWGFDEVNCWLKGKISEVFYEKEVSPVSQGIQQPGSSGHLGKLFPFSINLGESSFFTLEEFLQAAFSSREKWDEGKKLIETGGLQAWLLKNDDRESAEKLLEFSETEKHPDKLLFKIGVFFYPEIAFCWRGKVVNEEFFTGLLDLVAQGNEDRLDLPLVEGLFSGDLFDDFFKSTGRSIGKIDIFRRQARSMMGTGLEALSLNEKAQILLSAFQGRFAGASALKLIATIKKGESRNTDSLFTFLKIDGFSNFAQESGLWRMGDAEIWSMTIRIAEEIKDLGGVNLDEFFRHEIQILSAIRKDVTLTEFIVKIFKKTSIDFNLMKQTREYSLIHPWVDPLIRGVYGLPSKIDLQTGLGNIVVTLNLRKKWDQISGKYLVPPFLFSLYKGGVVSEEKLKIAREVMAAPNLLVPKSTEFPTWGALTSASSQPAEIPAESLAHFEFLRKALVKPKWKTVANWLGKALFYLFTGYFSLVLMTPITVYGVISGPTVGLVILVCIFWHRHFSREPLKNSAPPGGGNPGWEIRFFERFFLFFGILSFPLFWIFFSLLLSLGTSLSGFVSNLFAFLLSPTFFFILFPGAPLVMLAFLSHRPPVTKYS